MLGLYLGEDDESFGVKDEDVAALCTDHQTADAVLVSRALLQGPDAGDDCLKHRAWTNESERGALRLW